MSRLPVSAIIPSSGRRNSLYVTLQKIQGCVPPPSEVLVHLDVSPPGVAELLRSRFPQVKILESDFPLGPGGGRQRLIEAAQHELVASFDDDSFPEEVTYFARAFEAAAKFPDAAVISAASPGAERQTGAYMSLAIYSGCGCVFRRSMLLQIPGFVPLPIAYGMEEVDVSLQLHAGAKTIVHDPLLYIRHEHPIDEKCDISKRNAITLANTLLLPWLRYPLWLFPIALIHLFNRMLWMLKSGNPQGLFRGLILTPEYLWRYRLHRSPLPVEKVISWLRLRRSSVFLGSC